MSSDSPAAILFSRDGYDVAIKDGYTIISEQTGIILAGKNGSTAKFIKLDGYGQTIIVGAGASGSAVTGNPVLVSGSDGTNARTIKTLTDGTQVTRYKELATFTGVASDIAIGNNKSMFSIVNASGSTVTTRISGIYIINSQITSVSGVIGVFELRRITNHSVGTAITAIETMNTADSLSSSITIRTNATVTSESTNLLWRTQFSTDELTASANLDSAFSSHIFGTMFPVWQRKDYDNKPITLNANEGLTVKFVTNSTAGTFDILVVFTQE